MKQVVLLLLFYTSVFSQKTTESFLSNKLGETREITIGLPPSYEKKSEQEIPNLNFARWRLSI